MLNRRNVLGIDDDSRLLVALERVQVLLQSFHQTRRGLQFEENNEFVSTSANELCDQKMYFVRDSKDSLLTFERKTKRVRTFARSGMSPLSIPTPCKMKVDFFIMRFKNL